MLRVLARSFVSSRTRSRCSWPTRARMLTPFARTPTRPRSRPLSQAKRNRRNPVPHDRAKHKQRNLLKRPFNTLKNWRRIATRYDKTRGPSLGFANLASALSWLPFVDDVLKKILPSFRSMLRSTQDDRGPAGPRQGAGRPPPAQAALSLFGRWSALACSWLKLTALG